MDEVQFDAFTVAFSTAGGTRRSVLARLGSGGLGVLLAMVGVTHEGQGTVLAKGGKHKHKHNDHKSCDNGLQKCGNKCVDLSSDGNHCGACDAFCGLACCSGTCVDVLSDPRNCLTCGQICSDQEECVNGECQRCPSGQTRCSLPDGSSVCADLASDTQNCGACGVVCPENEECETTNGGTVGTCTCDGPFCPTTGGSRCCAAAGGVCCASGRCCPAGQACQPNEQCCDSGEHLCPDGVTCCPDGTLCTGGRCESPDAAASGKRSSSTRGRRARAQL
jgi:hypothetical protein